MTAPVQPTLVEVAMAATQSRCPAQAVRRLKHEMAQPTPLVAFAFMKAALAALQDQVK